MRTSTLAVNPKTDAQATEEVRPAYLEALGMIERLHRLLLDVIKSELQREEREDLSPSQALLLYNIGVREVTATELVARGYYVGSNASYNIKKLTEDGFLENQRSSRDRRRVCIRLTEKGRDVCVLVEELYQRHMGSLGPGSIDAGEFATLNRALHHLERFWSDQIMYRL